MNSYALTLVIKPDLEEKARNGLLKSLAKRFGKLEKEELWGSKDLSYPIKHFQKGWYSHYLFSADPKAISSLDKALKMDEDIIRYLLIRV